MIEIIIGLATVSITIFMVFTFLDAKLNRKAKHNPGSPQNIADNNRKALSSGKIDSEND
ncbi:MAG: hypothetical protein ABIG64_07885 [Candidatus Omnitrophota bacterium]